MSMPEETRRLFEAMGIDPDEVPQRLPSGYYHGEAFCLMTYHCRVCNHVERLWNSRDGVTPFFIPCYQCGKTEAIHVNWQRDECNPLYQPQAGERIFVTTTPEDATAIARRQVEQYWDDPRTPMSEMFGSRETAVEKLAGQYVGEPRIVIVRGEPMTGQIAEHP